MTPTSVSTLSQLISTAVASYGINLIKGDADLKASLTTGFANFTSTQADQFVKQYTLVDQLQNVAFNGFSATVFLDKITGKHVIAMRGTEMNSASGIATDALRADLLGIAGNGFANTQAVEMYRYYKRLTTIGGQAVQYTETEKWRIFAMANSLVVPLVSSVPLLSGVLASQFSLFKQALSADIGVLADQPAGQSVLSSAEKVDVTGHSLGGHLAILFARLFPDNIDEVVTINAPGLFVQGDSALTSFGFPPKNSSRITRVEADGDGVSEIGNVWPGATIRIAQENNPGPVAAVSSNHSSVNGNDSLAVMAVMSKLDTSSANNTKGLSDIVRNGSNKPEESYEKVVDGLRHILLGSNQENTQISSGASDPKRSFLYDNLYGLMALGTDNNPTGIFKDLQGKVTFTTSPPTASNGHKDLGEFLSLYYLTPFTLHIQDAATENKLITAQGTVGTAWQADRDMSQADLAAGKANFSDEYLTDRAAMLAWMIKRNKDDITVPSMPGPDVVFKDIASNTEIEVGSASTPDQDKRNIRFGGDINDVLVGGNKNDRLYGGIGNDSLLGGDGADYLEGDSGNDTLNGGKNDNANDILKGGEGTEFYQFEGNFGNDKVIDSDGLGMIMIDGNIVGSAIGAGQRDRWLAKLGSDIANLAVYDDSQSSTGKRLVITKGLNTITIENFDINKAQSASGYLGIKLDKTRQIAIVKGGGTNVFGDINFTLDSLAGRNTNAAEGTGTGFTIDLNQAAKAGDKFTLALAGGTAGLWQAILGDSKVPANGAVITLVEGQTQVSFGLVQEGTVTADDTLQLSATFNGADGTAVSNSFGINLKDNGTFDRILLGDQRPQYDTPLNWPHPFKVFDVVAHDLPIIDGIQYQRWYTKDGNLIHGVAEANFNDVLTTWLDVESRFGYGASPEVVDNYSVQIKGLGGNDALGGYNGKDELDGGDGDDLIGGGSGSDRILGGAGNDYIFSSARLTDQTIGRTLSGGPYDFSQMSPMTDPLMIYRTTTVDAWNPPNNEEVLIKGSTWGVYQDPKEPDGTQPYHVDGILASEGNDADYVDGGAGNDHIITSGGNDYVQGGSGDDTITGLAGNDVLYGGDDKDTIDGDGTTKGNFYETVAATQHGDDFIDGGGGDDTLRGNGGNDSLFGGTGDDVMGGDGAGKVGDFSYLDPAYNGNDYMDGEDGDDTMQGGGKDDTMYGGAGKDQMWGDTSLKENVNALIGNDYLDGEGGDDELVGGAKDDTLYGGDGSDALWGDGVEAGMDGALNGKDYLDGGDGNDQLVGGGNEDTLYGGKGDDILIGDDDLSIVAAEFQASDYLDGGDGDDQLDGGGGNDTLIGGDGNDLLDGGTGADYMEGGAGNDTYIVDSEDDVIVEIDNPTPPALSERANLVLDAGAESTDAVGFNGLANTPISSNISPNISSNISPNTLQSFDASAGEVNNVQASISYTLGANLNNLVLVGTAAINGTGNDLNNELIGNSAANILDGGAGNDFIDGGAGIDTMIGGSGDDIYNVDDIADVVQEAADEGNDVVQSSVSYTLQENVERLIATGTAAINLTGNSLSNGLFGNGASNILNGGVGNDYLMGGAGNDFYLFKRGDGQDIIDNTDFFSDSTAPGAAAAVDTLRFGAGITDADIVAFGSGNDLYLRIKGTTDQICVRNYFASGFIADTSFYDYKLDRVEFANGVVWNQAMIQAAVDQAANNHQPTVANSLPSLKASVGNPFSYTVPAGTIVDQDAGDTVFYSAKMADGSALPTWLTFDAASLTFSGTPDTPDLGNLQFVLWGRDNYSAITGTTVSLSVDPNHAPLLSIPLVDPALTKGTAFTYTVPSAAFVDADAGDSLSYSATLSNGDALPAWLSFDAQTRSFTGTPADYGTTSVRILATDHSGLSIFDEMDFIVPLPVVVGTPGDDTLRGGTGDDIITGLAGNDLIIAGAGNDTIDGGADNDTISGDDGDDTINGGAGVDKLYGAAGNDTYVFDAAWGYDTVTDTLGQNKIVFTSGITRQDIRASSSNNDLILNRVNSTDQITIKNALIKDGAGNYNFPQITFADGTTWDMTAIKASLMTGGFGVDSIVGTSDADSIRGDAGNDVLSGQAGNDTLLGETGNDILSGGGDNDALDGGEGNDTLNGEDGDDVLIGGAGDDVLRGGQQNDTYRFGRNQGSDYIFERDSSGLTGGNDQIVLDAGIAPADIQLYRSSSYTAGLPNANNIDDLVLVINGSGQQIRIGDYFNTIDDMAIENIVFQDGTVWNKAAILARLINQSGAQSSLPGTAGNDTFVVDNSLDQIEFGVVGGNDKILSSVSYVMPTLAAMPSLLNLDLTGVLNINATGNIGGNTIHGNSGNNVIDGGTGIDTLIGGLGDDTYKVEGNAINHESGLLSDLIAALTTDAMLDTVTENSNEGNDTIVTSAYHAKLPDNIENLVVNGYTSSYVERSIVGNALDNVIDVFATDVGGAIRIDGGVGADTMIGGSNNDTYVVDNAGDVVIELSATTDRISNTSIDTVESSINYTLGLNIENLVLTGSAQINGTGNALNNRLDGSKNTAINHLYGGTGDDTYVADGIDVIHENAGEGNDTVVIAMTAVSTYSVTDFANVENISLDDIAGNSTLRGDNGNNMIVGNASANELVGGAGDDVIVDNSNHGRRGDPDNLYIVSDNDILSGGAGNDKLFSYGGADTLDGGQGDDQLTGGTGDTSYIFGAGDGHDRILYDAGNGTGWSAGVDSIILKSDIAMADVVLVRVDQTLQVQIRGTQDAIDIENFFTDATALTTFNSIERLQFADGSYWDVAAMIARLQSGNTNLSTAGSDVVIGTVNSDVMDGLDGDDVITAGAGNDTITGNAGSDLLFGGAGNDILIGGIGDDVLVGGAGADTYRFSRGFGSDVIEEIGAPSATELDVIEFGADIAVADVIVQKGNYLGTLIIKIKGTSDQIVLRDKLFHGDQSYANGVELIRFADGTTWTAADLLIRSQVIYGTELDDSLSGDDSDNTMFGYAGNDFMGGGLGNDTLDGGIGADTMYGDQGNDTYIVDNSGDVVQENADFGTDTVNSSITYTLTADVENLTLTGTAAINGTGNILANVITGNSGNNVLNGGAGADTLIGGAGNDTYVVDNVGDIVTELTNEGSDTVQTAMTYTLGTNVENLTLTGTSGINGTGNILANTLTGNSGANILDGGAGIDSMIGGAGNDTYVVDNTAEVVTEAASAGTDLVQSSATYTLSVNVENLTLTGTTSINGTGNSAVNTITGNSGNNILDGGAGIDTLIGGAGDDTYVIDTASDIITELVNGGTDTVLSAVNYTLGATSNLENLTLTGAALTGTGNTLANVITGNSAANTLDGGAGIDTLIGGAGNDIYVVDNTADVVTENASEGTDLVNSSVSYTLSANVENLTLTGTTAINGTGNLLANTLTGNSGDNILDGGAGIDTLIGGAGNDTYVVDNTADVVTEAASAGTDLVQSSATYTIGVNVENLTLTGIAAINGTGNTAVNILTGNSGNNILDGGAGIDTMIGGAGNDTYMVDNTADVVTENAAEGSDQVQSSATYTLLANIEALYLTGSGSINGTGNTLDNLIVGNSGINTLNGAAGNDILQGGAGVDTLTDTLGNNVLDGGVGADIITAGAGNDFIIGGTGNDTITTGQGADVIAFNRGDGMDIINASTVKDNTLSLGKGITYADLLFKKSGNDLILVTGASEQMTIKDWYLSTANHNIANLQIVIEGTADYNAASSSVINNKKIEQFNFDGLVTKFDQARVANPALTSWALSSSLLSFYLAGSDTAAIGGDLAYQYAKNGNLSSFSMAPAQALLANPQFGIGNQALQPVGTLMDASPRLV